MPATTALQTRANASVHSPWSFGRFDWPEFGLLSTLMHAVDNDAIRVEEFVEDDTLVVRAEMPGVDPDRDIDVSIEGGMLQIGLTRESRIEHTRESGFRTEFHYGTFRRSISLPAGTYESEVKGTYHHGVLEVRLPIPTSGAHKIHIAHG